jgi:hypothetical protein
MMARRNNTQIKILKAVHVINGNTVTVDLNHIQTVNYNISTLLQYILLPCMLVRVPGTRNVALE